MQGYGQRTSTDRSELLDHTQVFAGYAAVAVANVTSHARAVNDAAPLRKAMETRAVIEQAKGMLMARDKCTADEAFGLMNRISQQQNVKLRDLALRILEGGQK